MAGAIKHSQSSVSRRIRQGSPCCGSRHQYLENRQRKTRLDSMRPLSVSSALLPDLLHGMTEIYIAGISHSPLATDIRAIRKAVPGCC